MKFFGKTVAIFLIAAMLPLGASGAVMELDREWGLASSADVKASGGEISAVGFDASGWYNISAPSTVLAGLVANGVYPDPYFGMNYQNLPGVWPKPLDNSIMPMPPLSPFRKSFFYRTEFDLPADLAGKQVWIEFQGINYKANIWMNGKKVAGEKDVRGTYRIFTFNVTPMAEPGKMNALAVEVFPSGQNDLAITWVDWNPAPPDRNMGLWRKVTLYSTGTVDIRHPFVKTDLPLPSTDSADLTVFADLVNTSAEKQTGALKADVAGVSCSKNFELAPNATSTVTITPADCAGLHVENPELWWPYQLGEPKLHDLKLDAVTGAGTSDVSQTRFGIREINAVRNDADFFIFSVNGKNILIRGGGWTPDNMFRQTPERLDAELRYAKHMNLNALRIEGKMETDLFFDKTDEMGILVITGWCCCHHWERWARWDAEDYMVAEASQRDQTTRLRAHPSMLLWMNASDKAPPEDVERMYLRVLDEVNWPNPSVSSANDEATSVTGPSGVKMTGPYEWVPPVYWYLDKENGGAFGFNTETSPGPAVPEVESLELMLGKDHLWPIDEVWNYHTGRGQFGNLNVFTEALEKRYGKTTDVHDYARKSQAMTYEAQRAMFEAYSREKYKSTGVIQWMYSNGWPSLIWHLYDYYLRPGGGFYGTRHACEPLHVQYSYDDRSVVVVNSTLKDFTGLTVKAQAHDLNGNPDFEKEETVSVGPDGVVRAFTIPENAGGSTTWFLKLSLLKDGELLDDNFYWLSQKPDTLNWPLTQWYFTPQAEYTDYTALQTLPMIALRAAVNFTESGDEGSAKITVENPGKTVAFMVRLQVLKGAGGEEVLPVYMSDNYFTLMPGETREIEAGYFLRDLAGEKPALAIKGWNITPATID